MKNSLKKAWAILGSHKKSLTALAVGAIATTSAYADDLVTVTEGTVSFDSDALVSPIRDSLVDAIMSASTIFVIIAGVFFIVMMIKKFRKG